LGATFATLSLSALLSAFIILKIMKFFRPIVTLSLSIALTIGVGGGCREQNPNHNRAQAQTATTSQGLVNGKLIPQQVYPVRSDVMAIEINSGTVIRGKQNPFNPQFGDRYAQQRPAQDDDWVKGLGGTRGALVGRDRKLIYSLDQLGGKDLRISDWRNSAKIRVRSNDDPTYRQGPPVRAIYRKMRPRDQAQIDTWKFAWAKTHILYLKLPAPMRPGKTYSITSPDPNVGPIAFTYQPDKNRSEAVQVSQLGFRPDDPTKQAFLSTWMGDGGGLTYPVGQDFWLVDGTGKRVFSGKTARSRSATEAEDARNQNYNRTNVDVMDFSAFKQPGKYRVCVATIGCSFPFELNPKSWRIAFYTAVRGLYHQRAGIAIGAPYSTYKRPRAFHPADGVKVYQATARLADNDQGFLRAPKFADVLGKTQTQTTLPNAWGGYFDAGDWDRRIQHIEVSRSLIELAEMFPDYFSQLDLNLPESRNALPDIIDEALWNIDFYRRMQAPDGGISGGIQSANYSRQGEASWQETLPILAYKRDPWSSYLYVAGAAQIALWFETRDPAKAAIYRASAERAMGYAEANLNADPTRKYYQVRDARNLAAIAMVRLNTNGEKAKRDKWHKVFVATTVFYNASQPIEKWERHDQREAAFLYLRLPASQTEPKLRANIQNAFFRAANNTIASTTKSAHKWAKDDDYAPIGWGNGLSTPRTTTLLRAHYLSQDDRYLQAATRATQFAAGANPLNMVYTTGLGNRSPKNPLIIDHRITGQAPPPGITVYGPLNPKAFPNDWFTKLMAPAIYPAWSEWPTTEAYFDVYTAVAMSEFTVMQTIGPTAYTWGYLAARPVKNR
jgi:endoglucanase